MDINKEELVNSVDTELLDSQIDQITDSFIEEHFLDNDEAEQLEMLVAKSMKLGELYERKKWQEKATSEGFVLVPKKLSDELNDHLWDFMTDNFISTNEDGDSYIACDDFDLRKFYSEIIEAQEQSHD
ncbi:hypothetical protein [Acinetobacter guillouiae]|uniref:hypothetical protein n=1 Tax=Acinetobacter guillouiae TaxID=106649 RepID=UPI003C6FF1BE